MPAAVAKVNGEWLWLGSAWVKQDQVVLLDDVPDYYSQLIGRGDAASRLVGYARAGSGLVGQAGIRQRHQRPERSHSAGAEQFFVLYDARQSLLRQTPLRCGAGRFHRSDPPGSGQPGGLQRPGNDVERQRGISQGVSAVQ